MGRLASFVAVGVGLASACAFCALALSDARFVMPMIQDPIRFLGLPALLGALAGGGAHFATNRG